MGMFDYPEADLSDRKLGKRAGDSVLLCAFNNRIAEELQLKLNAPPLDLPWSDKQLAIVDWGVNGVGHLVVRARAGTSKTTIIIKMIQEMGCNATARTLHSLGFSCARSYLSRNVQVSNGSRGKNLTNQIIPRNPSTPEPIVRLITKLHTLARETTPHAMNPGDLIDLAYAHDMDPDPEFRNRGYTIEWVEARALEAMKLAADVKQITEIDFADMIYLPVRNRWLKPTYDAVVVDEAQDMNNAQLEIALGVVKPEGRIIIVGDDRQAIYKFRGADSGSLDRLKKALNATELPLNTTYRCGAKIVDMAKEVVPDFEAAPGIHGGEVRSITIDKLNEQVKPGDAILSRLNAPLASVAMSLIRENRRVRIAGKDIGAGLRILIQRMSRLGDDATLNGMLKRLGQWVNEEVARFNALDREDMIGAVYDKAETIRALCDGMKTVGEVEARIDSLFSDVGGEGKILCSSVHRAKGLEWDRVFILRDTFKDSSAKGKGERAGNRNNEEANIKYVAITRARKELVWVNG